MNENMKRVLVTGGAGFIGSHTVDLLLQKGYQVVVFDNLVTGKLSNLDLFHANFQLIQADILDYQKLFVELSRCDAVLHLAALPSVPKSIEDPLQSLKINTLGFVHVLQAMRKIPKSIRLVYASSAAVYGDTTILPCSDQQPLMQPVLSPYALEKTDNERYADLFHRLFSINALGLRYFNVYGKRQDPKSAYSGVISRFIERYQKNEAIIIYGDGEQARDFIHVADIARANVLALESDYVGVMNIATGVPRSLKELVNCIEKAGKKPAQYEFAAPRAGDIARSYGSVQLAEDVLGFRPEVPLEQGVEQLLAC